LLLIIINYLLDPRINPVKSEEVKRIKKYYFFYLDNALLTATQNSLNSMKHRVCDSSKASRKLSPFFEVDVQLSANPSLEEIQKAINKAALQFCGAARPSTTGTSTGPRMTRNRVCTR
jgi:hypothetical protein